MKRLALLCILLAGCVSNPSRGPEIVGATDQAVTINWSRSSRGTDGALELADQHCQKHGRRAQFAGKVTDFEIAYNCVKP